MITIIAVTNTWQAITTDNQSGRVWIQNNLNSKVGDVLIYHSSSAPTGTEKESESYRMKYFDFGSIVEVTSDGVGDIYYAKCPKAGETQNLCVDVV